MAIEGNDVASNLKWVMSSNSVAVMPRPTYETWFMEGRLIPNYHYIEVKPDFSDVEERLNYYIQHPEEAEEIIRNAHSYVDQFRDEERERLISLHVLDKYFKYVK
jgi:RNase adaptor protein for sRNA GlmZ degradation